MVNSLLVTQFVTTYNILYHYMNRNIPYYTINTAFVLFCGFIPDVLYKVCI